MDENLVYSVKAGVKSMWSGKALKCHTWPGTAGRMALFVWALKGQQFQAKDTECAMALSLRKTPCVWRIQNSSLLLKNKF